MSQTAFTHGPAPSAQETALATLFCGDEVEITIGNANVKKLRFTGKDCTGYLFASDDGKYYRYSEQETRFLLSLGKIHSKNGQNEDEASESDAKTLLRTSTRPIPPPACSDY